MYNQSLVKNKQAESKTNMQYSWHYKPLKLPRKGVIQDYYSKTK